jgi:hypothetical protein
MWLNNEVPLYSVLVFWKPKVYEGDGVIIVLVSLHICLGENTCPYTSTDCSLAVNVKEVQHRESTDVTDF